jgi:ssDNA thymidine ADP-ribosyltransferase, DarT
MTIDNLIAKIARGHLNRSFYHFTDEKNLDSIRKHGILSKQEAERLGVAIPVLGGNQWSQDADQLKGLRDYVNLCFTRSHPMCHLATEENRITPVYLGIDPEIIKMEGVKITLDVANKGGVELLNVEDAIKELDEQVLYTRTDWKKKR